MVRNGLIISRDGTKCWWLNNKLNRKDGPAIIYLDGTKQWFFNGEYHREDGPALELSNGNKEWWINGNRHREDGPAVEWGKYRYWYLNGQQRGSGKTKPPNWEEQVRLAKVELIMGL